jgi:hypothetical protein
MSRNDLILALMGEHSRVFQTRVINPDFVLAFHHDWKTFQAGEIDLQQVKAA